MTFLLAIALIYAATATVLWRWSATATRQSIDRWIRANDQFMALDVEFNNLKVKYAQALMQLEDARRIAGAGQ